MSATRSATLRARTNVMPEPIYYFVVGFTVLNAVIGMVTYVTLLERKFAARMQ